eukprot:Rhum_TRINITY_DN9832_c0_g1::Rhum_TRINITY_DN9832_c0_g1_i1::g.35523::m.35523
MQPRDCIYSVDVQATKLTSHVSFAPETDKLSLRVRLWDFPTLDLHAVRVRDGVYRVERGKAWTFQMGVNELLAHMPAVFTFELVTCTVPQCMVAAGYLRTGSDVARTLGQNATDTLSAATTAVPLTDVFSNKLASLLVDVRIRVLGVAGHGGFDPTLQLAASDAAQLPPPPPPHPAPPLHQDTAPSRVFIELPDGITRREKAALVDYLKHGPAAEEPFEGVEEDASSQDEAIRLSASRRHTQPQIPALPARDTPVAAPRRKGTKRSRRRRKLDDVAAQLSRLSNECSREQLDAVYEAVAGIVASTRGAPVRSGSSPLRPPSPLPRPSQGLRKKRAAASRAEPGVPPLTLAEQAKGAPESPSHSSLYTYSSSSDGGQQRRVKEFAMKDDNAIGANLGFSNSLLSPLSLSGATISPPCSDGQQRDAKPAFPQGDVSNDPGAPAHQTAVAAAAAAETAAAAEAAYSSPPDSDAVAQCEYLFRRVHNHMRHLYPTLRAGFAQWDIDGTKALSRTEFRRGFKTLQLGRAGGLSDEEVMHAVQTFLQDNGSTSVRVAAVWYPEDGYLTARVGEKKSGGLKTFRYEVVKSGDREACKVLYECLESKPAVNWLADDKIDLMYRILDRNRDGRVTVREFLSILSRFDTKSKHPTSAVHDAPPVNFHHRPSLGLSSSLSNLYQNANVSAGYQRGEARHRQPDQQFVRQDSFVSVSTEGGEAGNPVLDIGLEARCRKLEERLAGGKNGQLTKVLLLSCISKLLEREHGSLRGAFSDLNVHCRKGETTVSLDEFTRGVQQAVELQPGTVSLLYQMLDVNGDGTIDLDEFKATLTWVGKVVKVDADVAAVKHALQAASVRGSCQWSPPMAKRCGTEGVVIERAKGGDLRVEFLQDADWAGPKQSWWPESTLHVL